MSYTTGRVGRAGTAGLAVSLVAAEGVREKVRESLIVASAVNALEKYRDLFVVLTCLNVDIDVE